ncbi:hypothetical protein Tco_0837606 [Tanacetum coccineum]
MENSKKGNIPLHYGIKIDKDLCPKTDEELDKMSRVLYASAIGSIMYDMTCTRPDVSFALRMVSRHQQNPGEGHWTSVKNILKYLRNTKGGGETNVLGFMVEKGTKSDCKVAKGHVIVKDVRLEDNSADPFTKALAKSKHDEHAWSIGLKDNYKPLPEYLVYSNLLSRSCYKEVSIDLRLSWSVSRLSMEIRHSIENAATLMST